MKKNRLLLVMSILILSAGCQESGQQQNSGISRKDRLIADENISLKNELARCRGEVEKQQNLLSQCEQVKAQIEEQSRESVEWLMNELPNDLVKSVERLTEENEKLRARILRLGGTLEEENSGTGEQ